MPEIKPEVSRRNPYWISKHRYLQLVHFCLQYNEWRDQYNALTMLSATAYDGMPRGTETSRTTENRAELMAALSSKMDLIKSAAKEADPSIAPYLVKAVTHDGIGYDYLRTVMGIPCGRRQYYNIRRRFFWTLSKKMEDYHDR